ncbi:MAG: LysM peptidoglycan-binding domain-containing protein [Deltaproteobacteria bacterium]|nr:LysM peptidoglycan-binding domain-containing protein [Deltaproteobacteria bacterium]
MSKRVKKDLFKMVTVSICSGLLFGSIMVNAQDQEFGGDAEGDMGGDVGGESDFADPEASGGGNGAYGGDGDVSGGVEVTGSTEVGADGSAGTATGGDEGIYQGNIKPGITFSKINNQSSPLNNAAKNRTSISISADPKSELRDSKAKNPQQSVYRVKEGDTLWGICETNFGDSYVWPRIWSYNPGITNPNWIYPGDLLLLSPPLAMTALDAPVDDQTGSAQMVTPTRNDAILIRNKGFVDKEALKQAGIVRGAQKEIMLLSQWDEAYVEFKKNSDVQVGDEFAAYEIVKDVDGVDKDNEEPGKLVEILGAIRVTSYDKENKIARVVIDESIKPITRGTMIGPIHRRFNLIDSRTNETELKGHVIAHLDPTVLFSTHQIVFVDKGKKDGVKDGNRFFAMRKRDDYRASMDEKDDNDHYPFEVLAEMRVVETRDNTATCIVTAATRVLEDGADVEMVKGY